MSCSHMAIPVTTAADVTTVVSVAGYSGTTTRANYREAARLRENGRHATAMLALPRCQFRGFIMRKMPK